eukprot:TRINITY_DN9_c0_g1_i2.p1 TRINITY_DN9_c0_g1~~TRINITY_DN9_c0_g1_i2.p1  ORF type:complete len:366 (+),score=118.61 TRINITY_DN9_c0_g1_i2:333-1430(+)
MVLVPIFLTLEIDILENGIMERNMVLDLWFGNQEENSLDNGTMTKNMDLELNGFKMETDMKVNSKMESKKVKEVITGSMEINIMENGKMILFVEKEKNGVLAEVNMKDNTKMERNMEKVSLLTTLVKKYKVTYDTGKQQTKELFVEDNKEELASLSSDKYDTEVSKWLTENNLSLYIDNFFDQGFDRYEGEFKDGIKEGKGSYYWVNGDKYYGEWKNDFICGKGEEWSASGSKYEGQYKDGKKHGEGILIDYTGKKYKVTYDTGKQQTKELFVEDNKEELASLSSDKYDTEVSKWLTENNLSLYIDNFFDQGFEDLEDVGTLSEEEIQEELKITKLGHRRKIMKKINSMGGGSVTDGPKLPERDY